MNTGGCGDVRAPSGWALTFPNAPPSKAEILLIYFRCVASSLATLPGTKNSAGISQNPLVLLPPLLVASTLMLDLGGL